MSTYFHIFCKYLSGGGGREARAAMPPQSPAASAIYGRRTDRKIPFPNSKNLGGGNLKK